MPIATPAIPPRSGMVRRFWFSARGFWSGKARIVAWTLSILLLALVVGQLLIQYRLNFWNRAIFDALEKKDAATVLTQAAIFVKTSFPPKASNGTSAQSLLSAFYGFMYGYTVWANECPHFQSPASAQNQQADYQFLNFLAANNGLIDSTAGVNGLLK